MRFLLLVVLISALPACERFPWDKGEDETTVDAQTVERVVSDVLTRLTAACEEAGPLFPDRIPAIKDDAAQREGYENWQDFRSQLLNTDPSLVPTISRRITDRMTELLAEMEKTDDGK
jgi:hypothetical protein